MACSGWCWFPMYLGASIALAIIAISSALHSSSSKATTQDILLPTNASNALRSAGFAITASLLSHSPPFFLPPPNSTLFAIKDSAVKHSTLKTLKSLLFLHTTPSSSSSLHLLLTSPQGTCLPTLSPHHSLSLTHVDLQHNSLHINNVPISHPDLFLSPLLAIHGVPAPFPPLSPSCNSSTSLPLHSNRLIRFLASKGYSSFSIALHSVLYTIPNASLTVFAPPDFSFLRYPSTFLDRAVRLHILPQRLSYKELSSLPVRTLLKTMVPDDDLEVDGVLPFMTGILVNGVEIVAPDMFTSQKVVVHGISRAFQTNQLSS